MINIVNYTKISTTILNSLKKIFENENLFNKKFVQKWDMKNES